MEEAVDISYKVTKPNTSCILSPAAASYGFYLNFEKRGLHFKELVTKKDIKNIVKEVISYILIIVKFL